MQDIQSKIYKIMSTKVEDKNAAKEAICELIDDIESSDDKDAIDMLSNAAKIVIMQLCDKRINELNEPEKNKSEEPVEENISEEVDDSINNSEEIVEEHEEDKPEESTPGSVSYAVFYAVNHAAYVAIDERIRACVPVRNLAKAYCVKADVNSIANGQNELSKYKLDKLKPLQIKFLTQKEYDDTIGKAQAMKQLIENMPKVEVNSAISSDNKVKNFASTSTSKSSSHIGEKKTYDDNRGSYDFFRNKAYGGQYEADKKTTTQNSPMGKKYSLNDKIEHPVCLYKAMHDYLDDTDLMALPNSYKHDLPRIDSVSDILDFDNLVDMINEVIDNMLGTKAGYLVDELMATGNTIDKSYLMDIDYSLLDEAIHEWNDDNSPCEIMYVEKFDPTICGILKTIKDEAKSAFVSEEEMAGIIIYNYTRCLLAYNKYIVRHGIMV